MFRFLLITASLLLSGCLGMPEGVQPVQNFRLEPYLGTWYEIARLDHRFERGLSNVKAEYQRREDGGVAVLNSGYSVAGQAWEEAQGRAYFVEDEATGYLKVSFFGPFYGSYVVFELDQDNYSYAFVSGPDTSYLWLLSRSPVADPTLIEHFVQRAGSLGFDTDALEFVNQDLNLAALGQ
jgi:apolipoprotein D and lipocalin family protein